MKLISPSLTRLTFLILTFFLAPFSSASLLHDLIKQNNLEGIQRMFQIRNKRFMDGLNEPNGHHQTPLALAESLEYTAIAEFLKSKGGKTEVPQKVQDDEEEDNISDEDIATSSVKKKLGSIEEEEEEAPTRKSNFNPLTGSFHSSFNPTSH